MGIICGTTLDTKSRTFGTMTNDAAILRQAIELLLSTAKGTYWEDPEYGRDLSAYVLVGLTDDALASAGSYVKSGLDDDPRVDRCTVDASTTFLGGGAAAIELAITIWPVGATAAPIAFTAQASRDMVSVKVRGL